ncbi:hypothetical protein D3C81_1147710 [compost metagenome]
MASVTFSDTFAICSDIAVKSSERKLIFSELFFIFLIIAPNDSCITFIEFVISPISSFSLKYLGDTSLFKFPSDNNFKCLDVDFIPFAIVLDII